MGKEVLIWKYEKRHCFEKNRQVLCKPVYLVNSGKIQQKYASCTKIRKIALKNGSQKSGLKQRFLVGNVPIGAGSEEFCLKKYKCIYTYMKSKTR